jgi:hypothetical protein
LERDRYYAEGVPATRLYGATSTPASEAELKALFHATAGQLERSGIVLEFLAIMLADIDLLATRDPSLDLFSEHTGRRKTPSSSSVSLSPRGFFSKAEWRQLDRCSKAIAKLGSLRDPQSPMLTQQLACPRSEICTRSDCC